MKAKEVLIVSVIIEWLNHKITKKDSSTKLPLIRKKMLKTNCSFHNAFLTQAQARPNP